MAKIEAIPIPLDHDTRKPPAQVDAVWPWWGEKDPVTTKEDRKTKRPKDTEFLYRASPSADWTRYAPELRVHLRNNTGDRKRRNLPDQSLYSAEEIVERTDFLTEITFDDIASAQKFMATAKLIMDGKKWIKLGRGGAPAVVVGHLWIAPDVVSGPAADQNQLVMVLTSDLILRGPRLGYLSSLTSDDILAMGGLDAAVCSLLDPVTLVVKMDTTMIHGFNASSGLPRQPALAKRLVGQEVRRG